MNKIITKSQKAIQKIIFPAKCMSCGKILLEKEERYGLCHSCWKKVFIIREPVCKKCGKAIPDASEELCNDCMKRKHIFKQAKGLYSYDGAMKEIMYRFKYQNKRCYAAYFANLASDLYADYFRVNNINAIVPVPMYEKKKKKRGYNQAEVFAKALGEKLSIPVFSDLVVRTRNTLPQKGLSDIKRQRNLQNAFNINEKMIQSNSVILVDDIFTTGATADIVSETLRGAGIKDVYCMFICVGKGL